MRWDTVVIGSGIAGMTAAVALARAGQRVLVVEQHYLPGGWTQSFSLDQYRFSPGVHYIGDLHPGGGVRRIFEGLGLSNDIGFCELNPDGFDHFLIGKTRFDTPAGFDRFFARLVDRFPQERLGLTRYFETLRDVMQDVSQLGPNFSLLRAVTLPFRAPSLVRWGLSTLEPLLSRTIRDPLLRAILTVPCGNHGLAPSRASLPAHACMMDHYYNGGFYPRGGAKQIPQAMIKELRRRGGKIQTRTRVERILVERGRAAGVVTADGKHIDARFVVSNADPWLTYHRLLPREHARMQRLMARRMKYSVSMMSVFCAVDLDLRAMGYDSGNYWWFRTDDVAGVYERMERELPVDQVDGLFVTITTIKDPEEYRGRHTVEMFTYVPYAPFERWGGLAQGERGDDYEAMKTSFAAKMLAAAENVIPGITRAVRFLSVGTPVTNDFYCETHRGAALGTAKTPFQLGPFSYPVASGVPCLFNVGASTLSHGIGGAAISGLMAAQQILERSTIDDVLGPFDGSLRIYPSEHPDAWVTGSRPVPPDIETCA